MGTTFEAPAASLDVGGLAKPPDTQSPAAGVLGQIKDAGLYP